MKNLSINQRMTSLEIAEVTGKQHKNVMQAIRNMETAWENVNGLKFQLVDYRDKKGELRPCYSLTKTECLYIATKFNDEARAKLVLRWEELEKKNLLQAMGCSTGLELTISDLQQLAAKADYCDEVLLSVNCMTTTQVAKEMGMTGPELYRLLLGLGVAYWQSGQYMLYAQYARDGLARSRSYLRRMPSGTSRTEIYLVWTQKGRKFLHSLFRNTQIMN